ncbi:collagen triple helix repeat containing [Labeo rohita]|uniref:Collagen triple helix repeat containing n=1 Tax=Labeo rohita TaxID=84645 RepID=A0A498LDH1_LABRO|nr:collagen triple helix repeat containing [Labeo rohita]
MATWPRTTSNVLGRTAVEQHKIILSDEVPLKSRAYRVSPFKKKIIEDQETTGKTPDELMLGRQLHGPLERLIHRPPTPDQPSYNLLDRQKIMAEEVFYRRTRVSRMIFLGLSLSKLKIMEGGILQEDTCLQNDFYGSVIQQSENHGGGYSTGGHVFPERLLWVFYRRTHVSRMTFMGLSLSKLKIMERGILQEDTCLQNDFYGSVTQQTENHGEGRTHVSRMTFMGLSLSKLKIMERGILQEDTCLQNDFYGSVTQQTKNHGKGYEFGSAAKIIPPPVKCSLFNLNTCAVLQVFYRRTRVSSMTFLGLSFSKVKIMEGGILQEDTCFQNDFYGSVIQQSILQEDTCFQNDFFLGLLLSKLKIMEGGILQEDTYLQNDFFSGLLLSKLKIMEGGILQEDTCLQNDFFWGSFAQQTENHGGGYSTGGHVFPEQLLWVFNRRTRVSRMTFMGLSLSKLKIMERGIQQEDTCLQNDFYGSVTQQTENHGGGYEFGSAAKIIPPPVKCSLLNLNTWAFLQVFYRRTRISRMIFLGLSFSKVKIMEGGILQEDTYLQNDFFWGLLLSKLKLMEGGILQEDTCLQNDFFLGLLLSKLKIMEGGILQEDTCFQNDFFGSFVQQTENHGGGRTRVSRMTFMGLSLSKVKIMEGGILQEDTCLQNDFFWGLLLSKLKIMEGGILQEDTCFQNNFYGSVIQQSEKHGGGYSTGGHMSPELFFLGLLLSKLKIMEGGILQEDTCLQNDFYGSVTQQTENHGEGYEFCSAAKIIPPSVKCSLLNLNTGAFLQYIRDSVSEELGPDEVTTPEEVTWTGGADAGEEGVEETTLTDVGDTDEAGPGDTDGADTGEAGPGDTGGADTGEAGPGDTGEAGPGDTGSADTGETGPRDTGEVGPGDTGGADTGEVGPRDTGEAGPGDTGSADTGEAGPGDTGGADTGEAGPGDTGGADTSEAGPGDTGEAGPGDTGSADTGETGPRDTGEVGPGDTGGADTGEVGPRDTGEAGPGDTGSADTGEAGPGDTGGADTGEAGPGDTGGADTSEAGPGDTGEAGPGDTGSADTGEPGPGDTGGADTGEAGPGDTGGADAGEVADAKATGTEADCDEDFSLCGIRGNSSTCSLKWSTFIFGNVTPLSSTRSALLSSNKVIIYGPRKFASSLPPFLC